MLQLTPPDHGLDHLNDDALVIPLLHEILQNVLLRNLSSDGEPTFQLFLYPRQHFLLAFRGKTFGA